MVTIVLRVPYSSSCSFGCQSWKEDRLRVDKLGVVISLVVSEAFSRLQSCCC